MSAQDLAEVPADKAGGFGLVAIKQLDPDIKKALQDTVAKDTNDSELAYFLTVAKAQQLDPWRKEVWCIKMGGRLVIMTSADGYLRIAKRDPLFDSIQSAEVREGDVFKFDAITGEIEHRIEAKNRGAILGAWAMIVRTDGKRFAKYVSLNEYQSGTEPWKKYTSAMIQKAAKAALCKEWANITGVMAEEIMPSDAIDVEVSPSAQESSSKIKEEWLAKIAACQTNDELDAVRNDLSPIVGKLMHKEKDEIVAAAVAKRKELAALDVTPADEEKPAVVDAEIVEEGTKTAASADAAEEPQESPKATVDEAKTMLRECETLEALEECWTNVIPTLGLGEIDMQAVQKTYKLRIPLVTGKAPKKEKAA